MAAVLVLASLAFAAPAAAQENRPPTAPSKLRVVDVTAFSAQLAWNASTDDRDAAHELSYTVFGPPDGPFGDHWGWSKGETATTVHRLRPGTTYTFTVMASDSWAQTSPRSNAVTVTTDAIDPLPVPTNVRASRNITGTEVELAFDAAPDPRVRFYHVWRDGRQVGFVRPGYRFTATGLAPETAYEFTVTSVMVADFYFFDGAHSAPARITTVRDGAAPEPPWLFEVDDRTGTSVFLRWGEATDNVGVREWVVSNGSTTRTVPVGESRFNHTEFEFTGLEPQTSYTFTVRARDAAGNLSAPSAPLTVATGVHPDTEPPAPVTALQGIAEPDFFVYMSWGPSTDNVTFPGAVRYRLQFEEGPSIVLDHNSFSAERDVSGPQVFGCVPTVRAIDRAGNESAPRSVNLC